MINPYVFPGIRRNYFQTLAAETSKKAKDGKWKRGVTLMSRKLYIRLYSVDRSKYCGLRNIKKAA